MLADRYDPKFNSFNAVRLLMALGVIFWHSFPLTGKAISVPAMHQLMESIWVDGFFAVSGFLITGSWVSRPDVRAYVVARVLRIAPAFYVCLIVTAYVVAPLGLFLQRKDWMALLTSAAPREYIWANIAIWMNKFDVGGTPADIPWSGAWDGSLWTLGWEILCYVGVLVAGVCGLLRSSRIRSWVVVVLLAASWLAVLLNSVTVVHWTVALGSRFAFMFMAGATIYQFRQKIPCSFPLVIAAGVITVLSMWLPEYRLVGGMTWAYVVLSVGALVKVSWLRFERWDVSYGVYIYAFPIQQLMVIAGFASLPVIVFGVVATVPTLVVALISFLAVEQPALRLKKRLNSRSSQRERVAVSPPPA